MEASPIKKIYPTLIYLSLSFLVVPVALAQDTLAGVDNFNDFVDVAVNIINQLAGFLVGLAVFIIIWGVFVYITKADEAEKRKEGMRFVIYGVLGVFVMVSMWGFVNILRNTLELPGPGVVRTSMSAGAVYCSDSGDSYLLGQSVGCLG